MSLYATLFGLGVALAGCGAPPIDLLDNANTLDKADPATCFVVSQGDPTSCKDEATWSAYGAMACAGKGAMLKHVGLATSCGKGLFREATYECCGITPPPGPPDPKPTPTPPAVCMWAPAPVPSTGFCLTSDIWKKAGERFCGAHKLALHDEKLSKPCGKSGFGAAEFECCTLKPTPTPTPPPTPGMCTMETLADKSCVDDGTWKMRANDVCTGKKLALTSLSFGKACMAGGHTDISFTCCDGTPPPPPPPPMCSNETLAEMRCVDDGTWKMRAADACTAKKLTLGSLTFGKACMGGHTDIAFTCCPGTPPPPPPPPMCTMETLTEKSCIDDGTWKTRAAAVCTSKMLTLGSLTYGKACMGGHTDISFTCCGITPPPPPPPPMCTDEAVASMTCIDDAAWKTRASDACTAKKMTLTKLSFGHTCATGMGTPGAFDITYQCCGTTPPPPPPMCERDKAPSTGKCESPAQWAMDGAAFCSAKKLSLAGLSMSGPCMGGFSEAEFECCGAVTPPPPPPPTCTGGILGDGRTCVDEATLKSQAEATCKMAGTMLNGFAAYDACGKMGQYLHAKYECCK